MSVRRLAAQQPESFAFSGESEQKVSFWMNKYPAERTASAVIPLLWLAQKQEGWVSEPAMREIAARCAMPYIRVYEVATFYTMFNLEPVGEHLIQVCGTTPCWLRGADDLKAVCEKRIGPKGRGHVSADGKFSWEEVECLGACANAPMVQIANKDGDYYYEDLTGEALEKILDDLAAGQPVAYGPVSARGASEPFEAVTQTLVDESLYDGSRAEKLTLPNTPDDKPAAAQQEPVEKRPTDDRQKTQAATGDSVAKPAARDKKEADKPEKAQPKAPVSTNPDAQDKKLAKPRANKKSSAQGADKKPGAQSANKKKDG